MDSNREKIYQSTVNLENKADPRVISLSYMQNASIVLDVGCACGDLGSALKHYKNAEMYGLEYNLESVKIAMNTGAYREVHQFNLDELKETDFPDYQKKFDYIVCGDVLEHLRNPINVLNILKSYLKNGGYIIASIPNVAHMSVKSNLLINDFTYTPVGLLDETHIHLFTYKSIAEGLSSINLKIEGCNYTMQPKNGLQPHDPYPTLSEAVKYFIFKDWHSYVCQYVMKISISDEPQGNILKHNFEKINITEHNAPDYIQNYRNDCLVKLQPDIEEIFYTLEKLPNINDKNLIFYLKYHSVIFFFNKKIFTRRNDFINSFLLNHQDKNKPFDFGTIDSKGILFNKLASEFSHGEFLYKYINRGGLIAKTIIKEKNHKFFIDYDYLGIENYIPTNDILYIKQNIRPVYEGVTVLTYLKDKNNNEQIEVLKKVFSWLFDNYEIKNQVEKVDGILYDAHLGNIIIENGTFHLIDTEVICKHSIDKAMVIYRSLNSSENFYLMCNYFGLKNVNLEEYQRLYDLLNHNTDMTDAAAKNKNLLSLYFYEFHKNIKSLARQNSKSDCLYLLELLKHRNKKLKKRYKKYKHWAIALVICLIISAFLVFLK